MNVAITGHRELPSATAELVDSAIRERLSLRAGGELVGLSCLADGADAIFARAVLDAGGALVAVVPATRYRDGLPASHHPMYDALIGSAAEVVRLDHEESTSQAHMDASVYMLGRAHELIAVWDGKPARGYGGTADVVRAARERGVPVTVVWPAGAERD
ncbi:hypothetical protein [Pseudonocardia acaciae]|uniref:hypothetical protein n=1 Tax=Pseudonocardia acaciae TaxID=551276 RepID=UPI00048E7C4A|nr:hypothetical protein [Pseudonocardia acaciae]